MVHIGLKCKQTKNINMKQLLSLFLFLLPCLAWAQYPSNGNQKITLGEQTTADGLIYRGVIGDTALITPLSDTSAYIILDTANHRFYNYNRATNVWSVAGGGTSVTTFSAGTTGLTPSTATSGAVTLGGTLAVANGGTNASTFTAGSVVFAGASGTYTQDNSGLFYDNTNDRFGIGTASPTYKLDVGYDINNRSVARFSSNAANRMASIAFFGNNSESMYFGYEGGSEIVSGGQQGDFVLRNMLANKNIIFTTNSGKFGVNVLVPTEALHIVGNARITAMNAINDIGADANGVLQAATSDMNLKNTIENSPFGLNEILLLNPVTFLYNDVNRKLDSNVKEVGFIAQDVFDIIPNAVSSTGNGDLQLDYRAITATLTKAIQEQQSLIKALEQRIINLENK
jgi:hypothetical protein